jgi:Transposase DDE domain group 1
VHGQQALSGYHGYFGQHQYFPLHVYEGHSGFPLAAWLRPGTAHASLGAVDILRSIVQQLRRAWPAVRILVRADNGLGVPAVYEFCEREQLDYVIGYASNDVLERATALALEQVELYYHFYGWRWGEHVQRFEEVRDYQAGTWSQPRRVVAKVEINAHGSQRRYVVTNLTDAAAVVYRQVYVQRGAVPEQPIGEMKNGLQCDRLSACGFCANAFRLLVHTLAYAIVVLYREAAVAVPEVATASVSTLRQRLWKVGAVVVTTARRVWLHVSETWPDQSVWQRVLAGIATFVGRLVGVEQVPRVAREGRVM